MKAYNHSIYLMVGMPYLLAGGFGVYIYRAVKAGQKSQDTGKPDA
jgi:hypothetical protein